MPKSVGICVARFDTLEKCPRLRVCFAHGGGSFPATIGRIEHGFNVRPDLFLDNQRGPRSYVDRVYFDSLVHEPTMLDYLVSLTGAERVMLGTDYPFPLGELEPGKLIESMTYSGETRAKLFHGSACDWLGMDIGRFKNASVT
ncbi:amidohydrolase family protein [Leptolyngbya sp. 7M]|uniref:amidohydrolase family protein n=1 Tax=Leptolyngbya sp. 7M TaxID=2812896 RepID=UPI001B8C6855|nr:amidohydrolase family protein [Leptolyngbya sp. 7M]QYO66254.1 amidohydrolase [Leptolyngbya sp. 7M]